MKYFVCVLISFTCISHTVKSQNKVDSFITASKTISSPEHQLKSYFEFGNKIALQNFDESLLLADAGLELAFKYKNESYAGRFERQKGEAFYFKGKYELAAKEFYSSVKRLELVNEKEPLAETYNALAKLYRKTSDLTQSLQYYDKTMALYKSLNDSAGISATYNESGVVFEYTRNYEEAARRYGTSLDIDKKRNDSVGICYALSNLAGVYILQNKFLIAENYLKQSLSIRRAMKDSFSLALNYSDLANAYNYAGNLEAVKNYVDSSNSIAQKMNYPELISTNLKLLSEVEEKSGNYKNALAYFKNRTSIRDSIFSLNKEKQIAELNTKYETEKKVRTITEQQNHIRLQYLLFIAVFVFILLVSLLLFNQYRRNKLKREAAAREEKIIQNELAALAILNAEETERYRIARDLHDGVGQIMSVAKMNLSACQNRIQFTEAKDKESFENIISLIDTGCKEVRAVSHKMMPVGLTNKTLDIAIRDFVDKMDNEKLKVHFYSEGFKEKLPGEVETVVYRIVQECVNNVVKHAEASMLDISILREDNELTISIEDNGKGFVLLDNEEGIGLKNIKSRIEFIKGTVEYTSAPGKGTLVMIHVPL